MVDIKQLKNSEIEITAEISVEEFESYRKKAVEKLAGSADIPGFRKGHIPESVLVGKLGEDMILYEMADMALAKEYPKLITENNIEAIGKPEIAITKIAKGNPLGFKAKTAVIPEVELPDYKNIADKVGYTSELELKTTEKEVENTIDKLRENFARFKKEQEKKSQNKNQITENAEKAGSTDEESLELPAKTAGGGSPGASLEASMELTDEFVKKLGEFENVSDFKQKIGEGIYNEKKVKAREKRRMEIVEGILAKTDINPPQILIDGELKKIILSLSKRE